MGRLLVLSLKGNTLTQIFIIAKALEIIEQTRIQLKFSADPTIEVPTT